MNQFATILLFILSCSCSNMYILPRDFQARVRADKVNYLQLFINDVNKQCKDKSIKSDCKKYFPSDTLTNLLNRYKSSEPQVNSYQKYYQLKKTIHDELQNMYTQSLSVVNKNRKKGKQRSQLEIAVTNLSGQCLAVARKFQDQTDDINVVAQKVEEFKLKEAADQRQKEQSKQSQEEMIHKPIQTIEVSQKQSSEQTSQSSEQTSQSNEQKLKINVQSFSSDEQVNEVDTKQVRRRRIVVLDILECEDCLKKGYVNMS